MNQNDKWLTTKEAAEYLGYSQYSMRRARMNGQKLGGKEPPPHYGEGKSTRYKLSDLESWMTGGA